MAGIRKRSKGVWFVNFRLGGELFEVSLNTKSDPTAERMKTQVEETVELIKRGRITLPPDADRDAIARFVINGGKVTEKPKVAPKKVTFEEVALAYLESKRLDPSEKTRYGRLSTTKNRDGVILDPKSPIVELTTEDFQRYAKTRLKDRGLGGKTLSTDTLGREFAVFGRIWAYGQKNLGTIPLTALNPTKSVHLDDPPDKLPFMTWDQIDSIVGRGGLSEEDEKAYWDRLFLDEKQVLEVVECVRENGQPFIHAAVAIAAFTGARRSEIMRSRLDDIDFTHDRVVLREKKRKHNQGESFRSVPLHPRLKAILEDWLKVHPGNAFTIVVPHEIPRSKSKRDKPEPMTADQAQHYFQNALADSKWKVLRGWHVLRHSFCSNCARRNVPDLIIDRWMGHQGNEPIKQRYRHLFPSDETVLIRSLFC